MAKFGPEGLNPLVVSETDHIPERSLDVEPIDQLAHAREKQPNLLDQFTPQQQAEILRKQRILSSLAYFIGKDFNIPVELNEPGKGWHWDFKANIIRIDPIDLLEKPLDYLRFVISHEGGHRRISRTDFIPIEEWKQPGFAFMTNSIEDPRDNNFVADSYPKFQEQLALGYEWLSDLDEKTDQVAKKKLGFTPRFKRAGFEYIKQWFKERAGEEMKLSDGLPEEIKAVVLKTLESAKDSWWRYPSKEEADQSEDVIVEYAKVSYEINRDEIWPEFKKLVDSDMADEQMQEALKDAQKSAQGKGGQGGLPQKLKDKMTPQEQKDLEKAIEEAIEKAKQQAQEKEGSESAQEELSESGELGAQPIDLDSLSEGIKQKIKDYIKSLPKEQQQELAEKAQATFKDFENQVNEEMAGKLTSNPEKSTSENREEEGGNKSKEKVAKDDASEKTERDPGLDEKELKKFRDRIAKEIKKDANVYEKMRQEVLPLIDQLETELREIFVARKNKGWKTGFATGKRVDIKKRIQEKAKAVPVLESRAWQKREMPQEKDYAISLLVDLSGSMQGSKITETFKAVIVLSEVLNRLSINLEVLGFNDRIYEYQDFGQSMSKMIRENMGGMLQEVNDTSDTGKAQYNDDGWALQQAAERLEHQKAEQKFLLVLSDGVPEESPMHPREQYELGGIIKKVISEMTGIKLIGLGIGSGTEHVEKYYPNSLANIPVKEMARDLAKIIKEVINDYNAF